MRINYSRNVSAKILQFYINAINKYKNTYTIHDALKDVEKSFADKQYIPTNKTKQDWLSTGYNVARNKRGWAFAYIIKDDTMYIYDAENCRNLTIDYQNTSPFTTYTKGKISSNEWIIFPNDHLSYKKCNLAKDYTFIFTLLHA